jgi:hypothetical protein
MIHKWFVGSNGNEFVDAGGYRYCVISVHGARRIGQRPSIVGYQAARNGVEFGVVFGKSADAKRFVEADFCDAPKEVLL